jgi:hypothetical protein
MSLEKNLYFCKECLTINNLDHYDENLIKARYKEIYNKLQDLRSQGKELQIENICFSGGGIKTISYTGGLEILNEFALLEKIKRISTASAGTIIGLLIAFRHNFEDIYKELFKDQSHYFDRSIWSPLGIYGILKGNYGLHSGKVLAEDMRRLINISFDKCFPGFRKDTNYDPTFLDLYEKFNIELIVTGTNVDRKITEYFCPRLTPDMPLYIAARISMSYPLMFEYVMYNGSAYCDSVCAYPLHIFHDGDEGTNVQNPMTEHILLPTNDVNIFERTIGFNNYNIETNGKEIIKPFPITDNYLMDLIEKNNYKPVKSFLDYIFSVMKTAQYFIEKAEIRLVNSHKSDDYFKHTICVILKHFDIFDFSPTENQRSDAMTLYKIKTLEWIDDKINHLSNN